MHTNFDEMELRTAHELWNSGNITQNWKDCYQQFCTYLIASNKDEKNNV